MLGKVFENLLASYNPETQTTARKQTGSFYTPREIVNYMVDESLIAYLRNHVDDEEKLRKLFSYENGDNGNPFDKAETKKLLKAIDNCKILDPACGSGAFPMGVLQKMIHILHKLDPDNSQWFEMVIGNFPAYMQPEVRKKLEKENWNYVRKLGIIQQCIYGVDIQPIATQIAKLRFFISLLVDQKEKPGEDNRGFEPLPNLDFKIVTANTLIPAPASDEETTGLFAGQTDHFFDEFDKSTALYFSTYDTDEKKKLKNEIVRLITEKCNQRIKEIESKFEHHDENASKALKEKYKKFIEEKEQEIKLWKSYANLFKYESVGFFEPKYFFPKAKDGFDVVIGNPPYVEAKKLKEISQILRLFYSTYSGTADLYVYFYEKGIKCLKEKGTLVFITSNKFTKTSYGENLRKYFTAYRINEIIDFTDVHVFEALVASCIFSISNSSPINNKVTIASADDSLLDFSDLRHFIERNKFLLNQSGLSEKIWQLENETKLSIKHKIENGSETMNEIRTISIYRGVTTGYNPAFIINEQLRKELILKDNNNKPIIKPMLQGRNIRKWIYNKTSEYLIFTRKGIDINKYPYIKDHLSNFKKKLEPGVGRKPGKYNWFEIQDNTAYYPDFEKEKIIWGLTSDKWTFAYDNKGHFLPSNGYILTSSEIPIKYLLALINSRLMEFYFSFIGIMTAGGAFTLKQETVSEFPIKVPDLRIQSHFILLVDYVLLYKEQKRDTVFLEQLLNTMVYELYLLKEIRARNCEIIKLLDGLQELKEDWSEEKKLKAIETTYKELSDPSHPVSIAMAKMQEIEEIKIIEGKA